MIGNSPQIVFAHYRELVRPADAKAWFSISPGEEGKVILLPLAKEGGQGQTGAIAKLAAWLDNGDGGKAEVVEAQTVG